MEGKVTFVVYNDISAQINLIQLMETVGNVNHALSIFLILIYDFNYKGYLPLMKESLDLIFPSY